MTDEPQAAPNTLTEEEQAQGFQLLFDGHAADAWRGFRREGVPTSWIVDDGTIHFTAEGERGDIITKEMFGDFELRLEWKISPGGNSGIMFGVSETTRSTYQAGPEVQVLDNARHPDGAAPVTSAGSNYALHAPTVDATRPVGEWNEVRLIVNQRQVEHWLNGQQIVAYELGSDEWERLVANSKFAQWPEYGRQAEGHIALQDHGNHVWYRSIRIRRIEP